MKFIFTLLLIIPNILLAQLPDSIYYPWTEHVYQEPVRQAGILDVSQNGIVPGTSEDLSDKLKDLLSNYREYDSIYFPAGLYYLKKEISLYDNKILFGDGPETILLFETGENNSCFNIARSFETFNFIENDLKRGDTLIELSIPLSELEVGQDVYIRSPESELMTSSWALSSYVQFNKISSISQDFTKVGLVIPIDRDRDSARVQLPTFKKGVEISNLKIVRLDPTDGQTSNIKFIQAMNCKISCIESESTNFAHVDVRYSKNIEISGSHFHGAHAFGGGGQGYGTVLQFGSSQCVIAANTYDTLRHSILLQAGANGNVITTNYSANPYWEDVFLPEDSAGDLVLHGNWVTNNLFQHNIVQNIVIDDSHGQNGPGNTFFRNRAENYGIFMNSNPPSDGQIFIANNITNSQILKGLYILSGDNHYKANNIIRGEYASGDLILDDIPNSLAGDRLFPYSGWQIGEIDGPSVNNDAKKRYDENISTYCEYLDFTSVQEIMETPKIKSLSFNQAKELMENKGYILININGKIINDINNLGSGTYILTDYKTHYKIKID